MTAHQKRITISAVCLGVAALSMFLPFQVKEAYDYGGYYPDVERRTESGFDLILPLFSVAFLVGTLFLVIFGKNVASRIILLLLAIFNGLLMPLILFVIHFQLFGSSDISTGLGFIILAGVALTMVILSIVQIARPVHTSTPKSNNFVLDDDLLDL